MGGRREPTTGFSLRGRLKASEYGAPSREAPLEKATAHRGCETPREQALTEGLLKPDNCATRADNRLFFEGEALRALLVEGATRAVNRLFFEGEARPALLAEGATRARGRLGRLCWLRGRREPL